MKIEFQIWETSRKIYLNYLNTYNLEQLNKIPEGFTTNLIWHIGHVIVSQQKLVYTLSSLETVLSPLFIEKFQNGSKPEKPIVEEEFQEIKRLLIDTVEKTKEDFESNTFKVFNSYQTKTGFFIENLENAITFNNYHEGIHLGIMMQLKKMI